MGTHVRVSVRGIHICSKYIYIITKEFQHQFLIMGNSLHSGETILHSFNETESNQEKRSAQCVPTIPVALFLLKKTTCIRRLQVHYVPLQGRI